MTDMILIILRMFVLITLIIPDFGATKANKTLNNQDKNCITRNIEQTIIKHIKTG